jgi:hypothetical protein
LRPHRLIASKAKELLTISPGNIPHETHICEGRRQNGIYHFRLPASSNSHLNPTPFFPVCLSRPAYIPNFNQRAIRGMHMPEKMDQAKVRGCNTPKCTVLRKVLRAFYLLLSPGCMEHTPFLIRTLVLRGFYTLSEYRRARPNAACGARNNQQKKKKTTPDDMEKYLRPELVLYVCGKQARERKEKIKRRKSHSSSRWMSDSPVR